MTWSVRSATSVTAKTRTTATCETRRKMLEEICICLGGREAEAAPARRSLRRGDARLHQATAIARDMVEVLGLGGEEIGPVRYRASTTSLTASRTFARSAGATRPPCSRHHRGATPAHRNDSPRTPAAGRVAPRPACGKESHRSEVTQSDGNGKWRACARREEEPPAVGLTTDQGRKVVDCLDAGVVRIVRHHTPSMNRKFPHGSDDHPP